MKIEKNSAVDENKYIKYRTTSSSMSGFREVRRADTSFFVLFWDKGYNDQRIIFAGSYESCCAALNRISISLRSEYYIACCVPCFFVS